MKLRNRIRYEDSETGVNPMDGVSNMSDVMLVLAVGIMLALVINWKIDIKDAYKTEVEKVALDEDKLNEFETDEAKRNNSISYEDIEKKYVRSGSVYTDTLTGKTYVVVD